MCEALADKATNMHVRHTSFDIQRVTLTAKVLFPKTISLPCW